MLIHRRIALTGAAGRIGKAIRPWLAQRCLELHLLDQGALEAAHPNERVYQVSLADRAGLDRALQGCDAVVHLAG
jgi:nucleoside-diphosphate-sugar epimerase